MVGSETILGEIHIWLIPGLFFALAALYSSVGHAGTGILHRMWRDGTDFIWSCKEVAA